MTPTDVGVRLVTLAETYALPTLGRKPTGHAARVALLVMCLSALDHDNAPWYAGGWRPIARAIGLDPTKPHPAQVAVSRALAPLIDAGYIERTYETTYGTTMGRAATARWLIHVDPYPHPLEGDR